MLILIMYCTMFCNISMQCVFNDYSMYLHSMYLYLICIHSMFYYIFIGCLNDHLLTHSHTSNLEMLSHLKLKVMIERNHDYLFLNPSLSPYSINKLILNNSSAWNIFDTENSFFNIVYNLVSF